MINPGQTPPLYVDPDYLRVLQLLESIEIGFPFSTAELRTNALRFVARPFRAITRLDFEKLAVQATEPVEDPKLKVVRAVVLSDLGTVSVRLVSGAPREYIRKWDHDTLLVTVKPVPDEDEAYSQIVHEVTQFLNPRRLAGTVLSVGAARFFPVSLSAKVIYEVTANRAALGDQIAEKLQNYLDPVTGGANRQGWPYDVGVTSSDIASLVERVEGVRAVAKLDLNIGQLRVDVSSTVGVDTYLSAVPLGPAPFSGGLPRMVLLRLTLISAASPNT